MKRRAALAALAAAVSIPATARAVAVTRAPIPPENQTVTYTYKTFLAPQRFGIGPFGNLNEDFGTLKVTFNANGIISGTYKPEYGSFTSVSGGRNGNNFHISFGIRGRLTMQGHFTQHGIIATAQTFSTRGTYWQLYGDFAGSS